MTIYGVALLAFCFLLGKLLGNFLGLMLNIDGDIGGVGFAMVFLMFSYSFLKKNEWIKPATTNGILFWSAMYIPIVVAMSATQNVKAAVSGGPLALIVGVMVVVIGFLLVPLLSKIGRVKETKTQN